MVNVLPVPYSDVTSTVPPSTSYVSFFVKYRPSPVPCVFAERDDPSLTNGANNFGISSDIIPIPVSITDMFTILFIVFACNVIIPLSVNLLY